MRFLKEVRGLRLWCRSRDSTQCAPQQATLELDYSGPNLQDAWSCLCSVLMYARIVCKCHLGTETVSFAAIAVHIEGARLAKPASLPGSVSTPSLW